MERIRRSSECRCRRIRARSEVKGRVVRELRVDEVPVRRRRDRVDVQRSQRELSKAHENSHLSRAQLLLSLPHVQILRCTQHTTQHMYSAAHRTHVLRCAQHTTCTPLRTERTAGAYAYILWGNRVIGNGLEILRCGHRELPGWCIQSSEGNKRKAKRRLLWIIKATKGNRWEVVCRRADMWRSSSHCRRASSQRVDTRLEKSAACSTVRIETSFKKIQIKLDIEESWKLSRLRFSSEEWRMKEK